ncbi:MAG TPA: hypothetical protein VEU51_01345 [Candidatus Acidoferrales bacterium]|nr:hypothetical protein [Candidatus Acidoferrales bacterium]
MAIAVPAFAQPAGAGKLLFRVQIQNRGMTTDALEKGKTLTDYSELTLPGALVNPPLKLAPVAKANAKSDTPVALAAADFSAEKSDDADWIVSLFAPGDRADVKAMLADKNMRTRNRGIFAHKAARYVRGHADFKQYVLVFISDGKPDNPPQVLAMVKTPDGFRRTNALSNDDTFDIVWASLRLGEVKAVK